MQHTLCQSSALQIYHEYETAFCRLRLSGETFPVFAFYGDPACALISANEQWCLIGGDILVMLHMQDRVVRQIDSLKCVFALRQVGEHTVWVLTDPWSEDPAIWELTIHPALYSVKLRDFPEYSGLPFTEDVIW